MNNGADVAKLVGVMAAAYPNTQVSDATIEIYVSMLRDVPFDVLTASVQQCMAESDFLPSIAKLREKALAISSPDHVSAFEAWGVVKKAMQDVGYYRTPAFEDPLIAKAVACIGWQTLCSSENEPADRAHFARVFESLVRREEDDARTLPIVRRFREQAVMLIESRTIS